MIKMKKLLLFVLFASAVCLSFIGYANGEIGYNLRNKIESNNDSNYIPILIYFNNSNCNLNHYLSIHPELNQSIYNYSELNIVLRQQSKHNNSAIESLINNLEARGLIKDYRNFWIAGIASAEAKRGGIEPLSGHPSISSINLDFAIENFEPIYTNTICLDSSGIGASLLAIGAPEAWAMGYDGEGSIVCNIDTGVDGTHPALYNSFRGNNGYPLENCWFDPYSGTHFPMDSRGHGTHTMGIMCGIDGNDTIGVAPGAQWIAAGAVDRGGSIQRTISDIIAAFQWAADPDNNPYTDDDRPDVINNSWGIPHSYAPECDDQFWQVIDNCEALGIACVFAAGNEGPNSESLRSPADRVSSTTNSFAIGAINAHQDNYPIAIFSSRGPSGCDSVSLKPQVVAPGVDVRSCFPNGGYISMSGTSMAAPFVAGAIAILRQVKQDATVEEIKEALMYSAADLGDEGPDYDYGYGLIDIPSAIEYLLGTTGINDDTQSSNISFSNNKLTNYPNPFNSSTTITFQIPYRGYVNLVVYDLLGGKIEKLLSGNLNYGEHQVSFDGANYPTGIYFYRLSYGGCIITNKMVIIK